MAEDFNSRRGIMRRLTEQAARISNAVGPGGQGNTLDLPSYAGPTVYNADTMWIQITGAGVSGLYPWSQVVKSGGVYVQPGDARNGTVTASITGPIANFAAVEVNGNTNVPIGSIHRAWDSADAQSIEFD